MTTSPALGGSVAADPPNARERADASLRPLLLPYRVANGAANMALDEAMLDAARSGRALLRFYAWDPPCLSLGRHQAAPRRLRGRSRDELRPGEDAVRRPTGGRSVYHGPEITYAFACPDRAWGGPRAVYDRIHSALAVALRALGVPLDGWAAHAGHGAPRSPSGAPKLGPSSAGCFRDPAPGELTVGGRKLVGSAQCRRRSAILQHGSILIQNRQGLSHLSSDPGAAGSRDPARARDPAAIALDELLRPLPPPRAIAGALAPAVMSAFGAPDEEARAGGTWDSEGARALRRAARRREAKHRDPEWVWRPALERGPGTRPRRPAGSGHPSRTTRNSGET